MSDNQDPQTYAVIGAAMEAHKQLGSGFLEAVYHEAMAIELTARGVPHRREVDLPVAYKGTRLDTQYRADFVCFENLIVELKAVGELSRVHTSQLINYLKATSLEVGLLLNFGTASLQHKRIVRSKKQSA